MSTTLTPHHITIPFDLETPVALYARLAEKYACSFLLESAEPDDHFGRYSIIGIDKLMGYTSRPDENPFEEIQKLLNTIRYTPSAKLPRIQAPLVGYFAYESVRHLEEIAVRADTLDIPECIFFLPRFLVIMDHHNHTATAVAYSADDLKDIKCSLLAVAAQHVTPLPSVATHTADTPNAHFISQVEKAKEYISSGEAFQIVLSQRFEVQTAQSPLDLYRRLRLVSPTPYMYLLQFSSFAVIGSSPETLVRTEGETIITRPIAGTRRRGRSEEEDTALAEELMHDPKELAEHSMLVDLGRNDLGKVSIPGSITVHKHMELIKYSHVMHLVSELRGTRKNGTSLTDILAAQFPAGTLTGAPKVRAMELIAEMEAENREIYGGAVGYFDLSGEMDFAIAIRTMIHQNGHVRMRAGAGIVYDSRGELEDLECRNKARAPLSTVHSV